MTTRPPTPIRRNAGFTLTELMVAVAVLIVVIIATAKIFQTASLVTGLGEATSDIIQEAAAIDRQLRADFDRLSGDGFIVIRCVEVPNDLYGPGQPLVNPALPSAAVIRADQLFFFIDGAQPMTTLTQAGAGPAIGGTNLWGLGTHSRVYYGHAVQLDNGGPAEQVNNLPLGVAADTIDPLYDTTNPIVPPTT